MPSSLSSFIQSARKKKLDYQTIRLLLLDAGWKEQDIVEAIAKEALDSPVPKPTEVGSARDAFLHLISFAALYTVVINLILLYFRFINEMFRDAAVDTSYYYDDRSSVRWSLAALIVAFPLLVWISRMLVREMIKFPEKALGAVRRWLTYLTLFLAACVLVGDIITLIYYLLEGELSLRFLLKVVVLFILGGLTFKYFLIALRLDPKKKEFKEHHRLYIRMASVIVLIAVVAAAFLAGSPMMQREQKFDEKRVEDLQEIRTEVFKIAYGGEIPGPEERTPSVPIPETLEEVAENAHYTRPDISDPETGMKYVYTRESDTAFMLCASFSSTRDDKYQVFWNHEAGLQCFEFDVETSDPWE